MFLPSISDKSALDSSYTWCLKRNVEMFWAYIPTPSLAHPKQCCWFSKKYFLPIDFPSTLEGGCGGRIHWTCTLFLYFVQSVLSLIVGHISICTIKIIVAVRKIYFNPVFLINIISCTQPTRLRAQFYCHVEMTSSILM